MSQFFIASSDKTVPIFPVVKDHLYQYCSQLPGAKQRWLNTTGFEAQSGQVCLWADSEGQLAAVYLGLATLDDFEAFAAAAINLPAGDYCIEGKAGSTALLFWGLAQYRFTRYKDCQWQARRLLVDKGAVAELAALNDATSLVRDLINTPAEDMGPSALAQQCQAVAKRFQAKFSQWVGDDLLTHNFPAIHAVGRAGAEPPCLIELRWGDKSHPAVTLVGKGVCFDSGGLNIKPTSGMRYMKKDMGGAAHALALAQLIMQQQLPINLRLLIPAVENGIAGNAYRPGDIVKTRKGLTVEVGNTDAEGRVVLADALCFAAEEKPACIIDFATLTGAARVALGLDIGALFSNDEELANSLQEEGQKANDPVWRMPLFQPYLKSIQPAIANLSNSGASPYGGAITAALFLEQFVDDIPWAHLDIMAWNTASRPGKPEGGEALGLRAVYHHLSHLSAANKTL